MREADVEMNAEESRIAAGIVLYHPDVVRLKENIEQIGAQVDVLILVENGACEWDETRLQLPEHSGMKVIRNERNRGIAYALNQMAAMASRMGFDWLIMLDQDSVCAQGCVRAYQSAIFHQKGNASIGILAPVITDRNRSKGDMSQSRADIAAVTDPEQVITSGSCISLAVWKQLRGFDNRLFIDFVDTEYQRRVLLAGYRIVRVSGARLLHEVGRIEEKRIGQLRVTCTNHSPVRRYYAVRNRLYYHRKYDGLPGLWREHFRLFLGTGKIWLFEDQKLEKTKAWLRGCRDWRRLYRRGRA